MDAASPTERLLADAEWARRLAAELVGDGAAADDVVQEAWLAMARREPGGDRPLRPWLAEVLRNAARQFRRGESRRARREAEVARDEALPSAAEMVERAEAHRRLVDAVLALPEPLRRTVMLRWFEGLSAAEIARRTEVPAATVRWHLQKGLGRLREELDESVGGERERWVKALAPLVGSAPLAVPAATVGAGGVLSALAVFGGTVVTQKIAVALLGVVALGIGVFVALEASGSPGGGTPAADPVAGVPRVLMADAGGEAAATEPEIEDARAEVVLAENRGPSEARVLGRCVDEFGAPLAGCTVEVTRTPEEVAAALFAGGPKTIGEAKSDAAGRFEVAVPKAAMEVDGVQRFELAVRRADLLGVHGRIDGLVPGSRNELGDVVVVGGARVSARVVDGDGTPLVGVSVFFEVGEPRFDGVDRRHYVGGVARVGGLLELKDDPRFAPGAWEIHVDESLELLAPDRLVVPPGEARVDCTVMLRRRSARESISGTVVDPMGQPVAAGVEVALSTSRDANGRVATAADGTFRLFRSGDEDAVVLCVRGAEGAAPLRSEPIAWGTDDVELRLAPETVIELTVRDDQGEPVENYTFVGEWSGDRSALRRYAPGSTHPGGVARIGGLGRGGTVALMVTPGSDEHAISEPCAVELPDRPGLVRAEVIVPRMQRFAVRVETPAGAPVAGSLVEVLQSDGRPIEVGMDLVPRDALRWNVSAGRARWPMAFAWSSGRTDAEGQVSLTVPRLRERTGLRVSGDSHLPLARSPLEVPGEGDALRVVVRPAGRVVGRVTSLEARSAFRKDPDQPAGAIGTRLGVLLRHVQSGDEVRNGPGQGYPVAGEDGAFEVGGLVPGAWDVYLTWWRPIGKATTTTVRTPSPVARVEVRAGEAAEVEIDLQAVRPAVLRGVVRRAGRPLPFAELKLLPRDRSDLAQFDEEGFGGVTSDAEGRFVHGGLLAGDYLVMARPAAAPAGSWYPAGDFVSVAAGEDVDGVFDVDASVVEVRLVDAAGEPAADTWLFAHHETHGRHWWVRADESGLVRLPDVGPGRLEFRAFSAKPARGDVVDWRSDRTARDLEPIDVLAGEEIQRVERRIPPR